MASQKTIGGPITGKLGRIVTYLLNGKWVSRTIGENNKPPTELQLAFLSLGPLIYNFIQPAKEYFCLGFELEAKLNNSQFLNEIYTYIFKNAVKGSYPNYEIDFTKVLFSKGYMPATLEVSVKSGLNGLEFTWNPQLTDSWRWNDRVMLMAYMPELGKAQYSIGSVNRPEGAGFLPLPEFPYPVLVHTYVSFIAADHRSISDSVYTGAVLWTRNNS